MKTILINEVCNLMRDHLTDSQQHLLRISLEKVFHQFNIPVSSSSLSPFSSQTNTKLLNLFIAAKKIEGCSENTLKYYSSTLTNMLKSIPKNVCEIETDDIRFYLCRYQEIHRSGKVTLDNIRRIMSSFFIWLEDEDYISKSPVRRIHKVKATQLVKETLSDEDLESTKLGTASHVQHVHPHKFRRTMVTMAIVKGMPIEQLQKLLGHTQIDTTLHYAIVNEKNVKLSHQKYVC